MAKPLVRPPPALGLPRRARPPTVRKPRTGGQRVSDWASDIKERAKRSLPPVEGQLKVPGLSAPVEVIRDRWGVPHIYAENLHDVLFAQGFVVASERLFQLDFMLRLANGASRSSSPRWA